MAVYTSLDVSDCEALLAHYDVGHYLRHVGIGAGIENTNYFLDTHQSRWVLTVFERLTAEQLPYYLELAEHLARQGLPVPAPQRTRAGEIIVTLKGKPAALVQRVPGQDVLWPTADHCAQMGTVLARMHLAGRLFGHSQPNLRGLPWIATQLEPLAPHLPADLRQLLTTEIAAQQDFAVRCAALPAGPVHADLFRDNALFEAGRLSGIIDFYFAGNDTWLFDFCVTLNDWCIDQDSGLLDRDRARAFGSAYQFVRPFTDNEVPALALMARLAALRFWVSRLSDWYMPRAAALLTPKDPTHFERILRARQNSPLSLADLS
jgi:homoserine kinase type II